MGRGKVAAAFEKAHALDTSAKRGAIAVTKTLGWARSVVTLALLAICVLGILCLTGQLAPTYAWLTRFFQPGVWEAIATWATTGVAAGAFVYAKRQVHEARQSRLSQEEQAQESLRQQAELAAKSLRQQSRQAHKALRQQSFDSSMALQHQTRISKEQNEEQARIAQESLEEQARIAQKSSDEQARISQESLDEQARQAQKTRDEMAQPNVVMYAESNPHDWQLLEVVIKNFGNTPAYDVVATIDPPLQSLPNNLSGDEIYKITIPPTIPILAPNQEWRTLWDSAIERNEFAQEVRAKIIAKNPGASGTGVDLTPEIAAKMPHSFHTGSVRFTDARGKIQTNKSILDFDIFKGAMRVRTYGISDIAKKYVTDD